MHSKRQVARKSRTLYPSKSVSLLSNREVTKARNGFRVFNFKRAESFSGTIC